MDVSADDLRLDLSGVEFMSASTIGVIVVMHERLRQCGRSLSVRFPSVRALQLLRICGLEHLVTGHLPNRQHGPVPESRPYRAGAEALSSWVEVPVAAPPVSPDPARNPEREDRSGCANVGERALTDGG